MNRLSKILISIVVLFFNYKSFAISDDFKFVIDTIGIPEFNVYNQSINEDIYYTYNVFTYSNPISIQQSTTRQRFKAVPNFGKWTEGGGPFNGNGKRGEYYILGTGYSGNYIDNVYFPVDTVPETTPDKWNYITITDAISSWNNTNNYKYIDQLQYMKTTPMLFDELDIPNNISNSYNLISYGISANSIGLDKIKLNTSSTWKTIGILTARRLSSEGKIREAIFATNPMAANANIVSKINIDENLILENEDKVTIGFGSEVKNLNQYAKPEHIKEICSIIYINGQEYSRISGSKTVKLDKNIIFTVPKEYIENKPNTYTLNIKVLSYLYTEFSVDGLIKNTIEKNVNITIPYNTVVPIENLDLKILKKQNNTLVVSPLVQTDITNSADSIGIIESGRYLALKIKLKNSLNEQKNFKIYINNKSVESELIKKDSHNYIYRILLNDNIINTLKSWKYLRDIKNNYFNIDFNEIGNRISQPNNLKIEYEDEYNFINNEIKFDTIDNYNYNIGYTFSDNVINKNAIQTMESLDEWIK